MQVILENRISSSVVSKHRDAYIDVAKGLLMILVVLGHTPDFGFSSYAYWFHMPAFFYISGILHRQPEKALLRSFLKKKSINLLLPYFAYAFLIGITSYTLSDRSTWAISEILGFFAFTGYKVLVWGGERLNGGFSIYWYINCFLWTVILFSLLNSFVNRKTTLFLTAIFSLIAGVGIEFYQTVPIPWNLNVVPLTLAFYIIGHCSKDLLEWLKTLGLSLLEIFFLFITSLALCTVAIYCNYIGLFSLKVDLKYGVISNPWMVLPIFALFTSTILLLSLLIARSRASAALLIIGQNTLPIMYLHITANLIYKALLKDTFNSAYLYLFIGIAIPILLSLLFKRSLLLSMLLLGMNSSNILTYTHSKIKGGILKSTK